MSNRSQKQSGFTLVELSIVLVIIGLLIGGILAAQSMISTAKINAQAQQIGQFESSVMAFKTKHNYLPGDAPGFGGDGDGIIDRGPAAPSGDNQINCFTNELQSFWNNIDPNGYVASGTPKTTSPNNNVPTAKIGIDGAYILASAVGLGSNTADITNKRNFYAIMKNTGTACFVQTTSSAASVKVVDALALDKKADDGLANSGNIISGRVPTTAGYFGIFDSPNSTCSTGADYIIANTGYECTPIIRIGGTAGDPQ